MYLFEGQSYREREGGGKRERETERESEVYYLLVHSPNGRNCQSCADPKPGARSFFQASYMGAGAQECGPSSTAFPGHSRELDWKWSSWDSNLHAYWMLALQVVALFATPQHQPAGCLLIHFYCQIFFLESGRQTHPHTPTSTLKHRYREENLFFLKILFIYLTGRVADSERERQREKGLPSVGSLPKWLQRLELCRSETRSQELSPGLPCRCRGPSTWAISTSQTTTIGPEEEQPGLEPAPIWDAVTAGRGLTLCAMAPAPEKELLHAGLLLKCPQLLWEGGGQGRSQEEGIQSGCPCGCQEPNHLRHHCLFPGSVLAGMWTQEPGPRIKRTL
nr:uncharacterized protein LOC108176651 [Oryctolagus cuniculus]XP_051688752.1 uncharacterized protein LOC108176651 [Oryctolagus cuniculus]XP_051688753.1 uncharacterized protein LOC108176651 [Oryctolagus cuniculus]XP_051688754.1 uncharacterized protein LOC108176651 [Oryctolagus cuniculus]XP_051688755.1 uncharacterized protein LOC108176651 [Oryctolagus cuniculus]XP_051688756.1 uncharacterized protein LOC108176651 [Oryctolagus cuniculus]XP_051688757.1 uncharacterized protein LOC108176651 [Orycto